MPEKRKLSLESLDQVMPEVDRLLHGYESAGNWSLGQTCNHLATALRLSTGEGHVKSWPWVLRRTIGPVLLRFVFKSRGMPDGLKTPDPTLDPRPDLDDRAEAEALRATIRLYDLHDGPPIEHIRFGTMTRDQWRRFHAIHSAHHLNFLLPSPIQQSSKPPPIQDQNIHLR